jgi:hypothetical protein
MKFFGAVKLDASNISPIRGKAKHVVRPADGPPVPNALCLDHSCAGGRKKLRRESLGQWSQLLLSQHCGRRREPFETRELKYGYA